MKAVTWQGKRDIRAETVPDPQLKEPTDVIVKVTSTGLCGSDLHLPLAQPPQAYEMFQKNQDGAVKVVFEP